MPPEWAGLPPCRRSPPPSPFFSIRRDDCRGHETVIQSLFVSAITRRRSPGNKYILTTEILANNRRHSTTRWTVERRGIIASSSEKNRKRKSPKTPKRKKENGESLQSSPDIFDDEFDCDCAAAIGSAARSDGDQGASGNPNVPVETEGAGAPHAQESQSLQAGSHPARHRLHLRPAERTGAEPSGQSQPEPEETALGGRGGRTEGHHGPFGRRHRQRCQSLTSIRRRLFRRAQATSRPTHLHSQHLHRGEQHDRG